MRGIVSQYPVLLEGLDEKESKIYDYNSILHNVLCANNKSIYTY